MNRIIIFCLLVSSFTFSASLKIATGNYPILEGKSKLGNEGLHIEILRNILKETNLEAQISTYSRNRVIEMISKKEIDIYMGSINHLDKTIQNDFYYIPVSIVNSVIFYNKEKYPNFSWNDYKDLKKYFIGIQYGGNILRISKENMLNYEQTYDTHSMIKKLYTGRNDLIILVDIVGNYLIKEMYPKENTTFIYSNRPFYTSEVGIIINKNIKNSNYIYNQLKFGLSQIHKKGIWDQVMKKHYGDTPIPKPVNLK